MRTRFAPSPTGPLHLGHAYSAILAHDMARAAGGAFFLRLEDTDLERCKPEYEAQIFDDLRWLGISWDGEVLYQSDHLAVYNAFLNRLVARDLTYPCKCSRKDIANATAAPQEGVAHAVYPQTCKSRDMEERGANDAIRIHMERALDACPEVSFVETGDTHAGSYPIDQEHLIHTVGDVVIGRKDIETAAYFMASAIDDARQSITHVIRGEDLFDFTPVQVMLLSLLGLDVPIYHHHGLIRDDAGKRLAKRDDARAISKYRADGASPADIRAMVGL